jgi:hypothetical protein
MQKDLASEGNSGCAEIAPKIGLADA